MKSSIKYQVVKIWYSEQDSGTKYSQPLMGVLSPDLPFPLSLCRAPARRELCRRPRPDALPSCSTVPALTSKQKPAKPSSAGLYPPSKAVQSQQRSAGFIIQVKQCNPSSTVLALSFKQSSANPTALAFTLQAKQCKPSSTVLAFSSKQSSANPAGLNYF